MENSSNSSNSNKDAEKGCFTIFVIFMVFLLIAGISSECEKQAEIRREQQRIEQIRLAEQRRLEEQRRLAEVEEERKKQVKKEIFQWLSKKNSSLPEKIRNIKKEITSLTSKSEKLTLLANQYSRHANFIRDIDGKIITLKNDLVKSNDDIMHVIEAAYIDEKIGKIIGNKEFKNWEDEIIAKLDDAIDMTNTLNEQFDELLTE